MLDIKTATRADVKAADTSELLEAYNKIVGADKQIQKFRDRATAEKRTWDLIGSLPPGEETTAGAVKSGKPTRKAETPAKKRSMRFCFAPVAAKEIKPIRESSLRFKVYQMISQENGALFSEIQKACNWDARTTYEGIRLVHLKAGYGMWSENLPNGDIRIRIIKDNKEYTTLRNEEKRAA